MKEKDALYEPVISFREHRSKMSITNLEHDALYEKAFFPTEEKCQTDYALNTTTWD